MTCCKWTPNASPASRGPGTRSPATATAPRAEKRERVGWEFCHSIIDDHTRLAYTEIHPDEKAPTVTAFVARALEFFAAHDIHPKRLQTDNAWCYIHNRSLRELLAAHADPAPPDPATHPEAQREDRALPADPRPRMGLRPALPQLRRPRRKRSPIWLNHYNTTRNHSSLSNRPPISRVRNQPRHNNLAACD